MGVILPGVERDFPPVFSWDWDGKRLKFVGVGRERFEDHVIFQFFFFNKSSKMSTILCFSVNMGCCV